jgi:hypothetical protein
MGQARDALTNEMDGPVDREEAEDGGPVPQIRGDFHPEADPWRGREAEVEEAAGQWDTARTVRVVQWLVVDHGAGGMWKVDQVG